jgi:formylglycine-generating enzyme required for sulfatase activity
MLGELGRGGMGVVYRAEHRLMERLVAIKVINQRLLDRPEALERFRREVKAAAKLIHPNIVTAFDAEQAGDLHLLVMELVDGLSVAQFLERAGTLPVGQACDFVGQALQGLQHAFEKGMVHRDLKPQNMMLTARGVVKILDFGLARMASERETGAGLTRENVTMGTPDYMAPEQAMDAHKADIRADIYSLGCTLYCLLCGHPPFPEGTAMNKIMAHLRQEARPVQELRPDVPAALATLIARMMAKDPAKRPQTPGEVAQALQPFGKGGGAAPAVAVALPVAEQRKQGDADRKVQTQPPPLPPALPRPAANPWEGLTDDMAATAPPRRDRGPSGPTRGKTGRIVGILALTLGGLAAACAAGVMIFRVQPPEGAGKSDPGRVRLEPARPERGSRSEFTNKVGMKLVWIDPGTPGKPKTFLMGSPAEEEERFVDERPHRVRLTRGFYMAITLVTQSQWEGVMGTGANHSQFRGKSDEEKEQLPVDNVSWFECVEFCNKLSEQEGKKPCYRLTNVQRDGDHVMKADMEVLVDGTGYRLPTEAEWEYACRAGTDTPFWWGKTISTDKANYDGNYVYGKDGKKTGVYRQKTTPVKQFKANPWGLYDMHGNLWQWCQDGSGPYPDEEIEDPVGINMGNNISRVLRGGSWVDAPSKCRAACRNRCAPAGRSEDHGCRVVCRLD